MGTGEALINLDDMHVDMIYNVSWNRNGSLICTASKDKKVRVIDPRKQEIVAVSLRDNERRNWVLLQQRVSKSLLRKNLFCFVYTMFSWVFRSEDKITGGIAALEGFVWVYWD